MMIDEAVSPRPIVETEREAEDSQVRPSATGLVRFC